MKPSVWSDKQLVLWVEYKVKEAFELHQQIIQVAKGRVKEKWKFCVLSWWNWTYKLDQYEGIRV